MTTMTNLHRLIDHLMGKLFEAEGRRIIAWIDKICAKNQELEPGQVGFFYDGQGFKPSNYARLVQRQRTLNMGLWSEMDSLLADKKILDEDRAFVRQALVNVLSPCKSEQDLRDALPECLVEFLPQLQQYSRTRPPAFTVAPESRHMRQFEQMLSKMEVYSITRLIY